MTNWRDAAACRDADSELFHPSTGAASESLAVRRAAHAPGKVVCNGTDDEPPCPVRAECLAWIIGHETGHGVWGGLDPMDRENLRQRSEPARARRAATTLPATRTSAATAAHAAAAETHGQEQRARVQALDTHHRSAAEIGRRLGLSIRQVDRYRAQVRAGVA